MRIVKGVNPVGTHHVVPTLVGKTLLRPVYRVAAISDSSNTPSNNDPIITLVFDWNDHPPIAFAPYLTVPLSILAKDFDAVSKTDVFWI